MIDGLKASWYANRTLPTVGIALTGMVAYIPTRAIARTQTPAKDEDDTAFERIMAETLDQ